MSTQQSIKRCGLCREPGHNKRTCPSNDEKCAICFDNCGKCRTTLECGHTFDTKCVFKWLSKNNSCPCCRAHVCELSLPGLDIVDYMYSMYRFEIEQYSGRELVREWYRIFKRNREPYNRDTELMSMEEVMDELHWVTNEFRRGEEQRRLTGRNVGEE